MSEVKTEYMRKKYVLIEKDYKVIAEEYHEYGIFCKVIVESFFKMDIDILKNMYGLKKRKR